MFLYVLPPSHVHCPIHTHLLFLPLVHFGLYDTCVQIVQTFECKSHKLSHTHTHIQQNPLTRRTRWRCSVENIRNISMHLPMQEIINVIGSMKSRRTNGQQRLHKRLSWLSYLLYPHASLAKWRLPTGEHVSRVIQMVHTYSRNKWDFDALGRHVE